MVYLALLLRLVLLVWLALLVWLVLLLSLAFLLWLITLVRLMILLWLALLVGLAPFLGGFGRGGASGWLAIAGLAGCTACCSLSWGGIV
jgi:hypothetical protein